MRKHALGLVMPALLLIPATRAAAADWQVRPSLGLTFGGDTSFVLPDLKFADRKLDFGVSGVLLGEIFGIEADFGHTPGVFNASRPQLVVQSGVTTLTGNIVVALPRRLAQYTLRPYVAGGAGLMHVASGNLAGVLEVSENLTAMDIGGGVTGFLTDRIGVGWDVRWFNSLGGSITALSLGRTEQLSFWRVNMGVAIRLARRSR
jgi:opacity protein-like surface antigen